MYQIFVWQSEHGWQYKTYHGRAEVRGGYYVTEAEAWMNARERLFTLEFDRTV